jgi:hypothetical protein
MHLSCLSCVMHTLALLLVGYCTTVSEAQTAAPSGKVTNGKNSKQSSSEPIEAFLRHLLAGTVENHVEQS